jgi:hypothetical protein
MTQPPDDAALVARLLPCPFCAWPGKLMAQDGVSWVECIDCACEGPPEDDHAHAIAAWNTRAALEPSDKGVG